jgi:alpha-glucosidase
MSISGMGFTGSDIGGFAEQPSGELYARWIQLGVFILFVRTHSSGDHGDQEPWAFDVEVIDITRKFVNLRYHCCHTCIPCFGNILKRASMLKPLVTTTKVIYKRIIETTNLFWKSNFSMSYFGTEFIG